ncbi:hypothetical protein GGF46_003277 [Coemansia sp. RSA 552]|nr:hypothetical protein GGF46_003277 [Coemansia sp. RSA 552]
MMGASWAGGSSMAGYLAASLLLTLHNKMVLQWQGFGFPWLVTAVHSLGGVLGTRALVGLGLLRPRQVDARQTRVLWAFSVLYTANIAASNVSLHHVTVPVHQVIRGTVPVFTAGLVWALRGRRPGPRVGASLVAVVAGVALATYGDYGGATAGGVALTLLGTVLAALKTVATNELLVGGLGLRLAPLDLLLRLAPLALPQALAAALIAGETRGAFDHVRAQSLRDAWLLAAALATNGAAAFVLNVASFTASRQTSALAMTVAGNVKVVLTVILGCVLFHISLSSLTIAGIVLTLAGGAAYSALRLAAKGSPSKLPH